MAILRNLKSDNFKEVTILTLMSVKGGDFKKS